jgi:hypothetical protein
MTVYCRLESGLCASCTMPFESAHDDSMVQLRQVAAPCILESGTRASDAVAWPLHNFSSVTPSGLHNASPAVHHALKG